MNEASNQLSEAQVADFAYTDMNKAPEQHKTIAIQRAMGMSTDDISISTGYPRPYVAKILNHPPAIEYSQAMKKALDNQVVQNVGKWSKILPKAIAKVEDSLGSKNERVALTAALEYLDRHPSEMFVKRKFREGRGGENIADTSAIDELKRNAAQLEGPDNGREIESDESAREARYPEAGADEGEGGDSKPSVYPEPRDPNGGFISQQPDPASSDGDSELGDDPGWPDTGAADGDTGQS